MFTPPSHLRSVGLRARTPRKTRVGIFADRSTSFAVSTIVPTVFVMAASMTWRCPKPTMTVYDAAFVD